MEIEEIINKFKFKHIIKKKKIKIYKVIDDSILNGEKKFTVDFYNRVFDTNIIMQSMENRFTNNR